jgi:hypothetical protein
MPRPAHYNRVVSEMGVTLTKSSNSKLTEKMTTPMIHTHMDKRFVPLWVLRSHALGGDDDTVSGGYGSVTVAQEPRTSASANAVFDYLLWQPC